MYLLLNGKYDEVEKRCFEQVFAQHQQNKAEQEY